MDATLLSGIAGVVLALFFAYVPGVSKWFAALESTYKRLIMLALLVVTAGVVYGLACWGWATDFGIGVTCNREGLLLLVKALIAAVVANQGTYLIAPETNKVRIAKAQRQ